MTDQHDRLIGWDSLPVPLRVLGRERVRQLWRFGDLPRPKLRSAVSGVEYWSERAVARWSERHADWLKREGERWRVLNALDAFTMVTETTR